ncbi:hypothetical protein [Candidatus Nitrosocosmicus arcticus]|uniref:Roadblock/LAMTOR2 domain-containing protein n=1 Tax=Candidatus Nitrosocosmicus arcticus TaxID=2035267 RepID=A0A557SRZ7_9ARCH|nr:hypothetical protein [Candidatus Nitrosocosmicus arcticus]TVP39383.1 hypothetical protein NARC_160097 [Candidatus Nitrosocosmicus arcticus]
MENKYNNHPSKSVYHEKCIAFLNISEKIRYVGIINRFGRTVSGKLRKTVKPLLSPDQARDEHFIESIRQQLRNSFESSIGKTIFSITKNEFVTLVLIPSKTTDDVLYYVTIDNDVPLDEVNDIINKVIEIEG